ncbi:amt-3 [Symbiodinium pilosum]|uniref:Amt-3 protein n=1 Tax=Symbiodinium pilosum TaxID=2952 RepID=A0A812W4H4_SYMPI|nr:amt-3 [Symbiodinium pilosum]
MFISHTWWTPGWRKALALHFQSTWHIVLGSWVFLVTSTFILCVTGVLPLPFIYQANLLGFQGVCPLGCWILLGGTLGPALVSLVSLYFPCRSPICFVDVACIHQEDKALMQRGVHGIGGFLAVTRELRVLWSRLWCIFELAAFRTANPTGQITLAPLFVEMTVFCMWLVLCMGNFFFWVARSGYGGANVVAYVQTALPFLPGIHLLRKNYLAKHKLLADMEGFDLDSVQCYSESDRDFIHSAIADWYGSSRAFTRFVQGPLREELTAPILATNLRWPYIFLLITPTFSLSMETLVALLMGDSPIGYAVAWTAGMLLANNCFYVPAGIVLIIYLCDRFAEPRGSSVLADYLQSVAIVLFVLVAGLSISAVSNFLVAAGPWTALVWLGGAVVNFVGLQLCCKRGRLPAAKPSI